jgi:hypothetical protein
LNGISDAESQALAVGTDGAVGTEDAEAVTDGAEDAGELAAGLVGAAWFAAGELAHPARMPTMAMTAQVAAMRGRVILVTLQASRPPDRASFHGGPRESTSVYDVQVTGEILAS